MKHEETKQLKKGQTLYLPVTVTEVLDSGNRIAFSVCYASRDGRTTSHISAYYEQLVLPPTAADKPKYDPCRLFKKGDKATPRIVNGRIPVCGIDGVAAKINSVELIVESNEGERENGTVDIKFPCGTIGQIDPVYLELVTPVEELEPYHINEIFDIDDGKLIGYEVAHGDTRESIFYGGETHLRSIEKAKQAAEAERDRLNAEYRKEQNNG